LGLDFLGRRGDLNEINSLISSIDDAFEHSQGAVIRPFRIPSPRAARTGRDSGIGQTRKLFREQRTRTSDFGLRHVQPRDLPIPARQGQFELRFAKLAWCGAAVFSRGRDIGDEGMQINAEALVEIGLGCGPVNCRENQPRGQKNGNAQQGRGNEKPRCY